MAILCVRSKAPHREARRLCHAKDHFASRYVDAIITYCEGLATFPMRGRGRDDLLA